MRQELKKIKEEILAELKKVENIDELDNLEVKLGSFKNCLSQFQK